MGIATQKEGLQSNLQPFHKQNEQQGEISQEDINNNIITQEDTLKAANERGPNLRSLLLTSQTYAGNN